MRVVVRSLADAPIYLRALLVHAHAYVPVCVRVVLRARTYGSMPADVFAERLAIARVVWSRCEPHSRRTRASPPAYMRLVAQRAQVYRDVCKRVRSCEHDLLYRTCARKQHQQKVAPSHTHTHSHTHTRTHMHTRRQLHMHTHTHTHKYRHTRRQLHTYTHTHTDTQTR
jgi:hypothetical protein